ncbi:COG1361 S-layer family protein [Archaeoglobus profundus]|uniref:S-layer domain-like protein n=1 Tax=Archaeoglobus profundus (strain DSM 5631 / JCM 9629 / NBRC 100127 / Av18) TaxID=572546 RepID=D2RH26_ARCPA|nr:COG1361 S-layer family protein [Archaeoglobus profundus]ADB57601.1 S-layer domain-like protein [Archaeoglobus profundus DSM 5631]
MKRLLIILVLLTVIGVANAHDIDFHVSVEGDGKLHPGEDTYITLLIENEGKADGFVLNENTSNLLSLITTAKDLRVEIEDMWIPITVETVNPQLIGDLPSGKVAKAVFRVRVDENAKLGKYRVPIRLKYTKVSYSTTSSGALLDYSEETDVEYLKIEITRKDYDFTVTSIESNLRVGGEGLVEATVKNVGRFKMYNATLTISVTPPLKPNPSATSSHLGDLDVGDEAKAIFKVYVMDDALDQVYPAELVLNFERADGKTVTISHRIGLKVECAEVFSIEDVKTFVTSAKIVENTTIPSRGFIKVAIRDLGEDVRDAVAVLSFETPLLQAENSPYLGNLRKGDEKIVTFYVRCLAPEGSYRGKLIISYKNELGDEEVEDYYIGVNVDSAPIKVERVETKNVGVGAKGDVIVHIKNELDCDVRNLELAIVPPKSITPLSPACYVELLKPNEIGEAKFRIAVSSELVSGYYNLYLIEKYDMGDVEDVVSVAEIPLLVEPKRAYFEVISVESVLYPDETGDVIVKIRNIGNTTIHNGVVELTVSTPLTIAGGTALSGLIGQAQPGLYFIGTLKPNEVAVAKFRVDVDKDAGAGYYPAIVKIRYDDDEGYTHESSPITISIEVREKPLLNPVTVTAVVLIAVAVIAGVRFARKRR